MKLILFQATLQFTMGTWQEPLETTNKPTNLTTSSIVYWTGGLQTFTNAAATEAFLSFFLLVDMRQRMRFFKLAPSFPQQRLIKNNLR